MEEEIRFHLEARAADLAREGLDPREAMRRARIEFGNYGRDGALFVIDVFTYPVYKQLKKHTCRCSPGRGLYVERGFSHRG
jgi:hypothetical protein